MAEKRAVHAASLICRIQVLDDAAALGANLGAPEAAPVEAASLRTR